uniref:MazG nucleotide pyrophosphohydrolase domain-containing protein n=1 Tax=uncultured Desulfovibrio sp. TaxID=167968 RepID=UPI00266FF76F
EAGEAAQIIKKEGDRPILDCPETRAHFVEELCDVYMYLASTAMCYGITPQELAHTFVEKHRRNMQRW